MATVLAAGCVLTVAVFLYAISGLVQLMVSKYTTHLGDLKSLPNPSFFWGHLRLLHNAENTNFFLHWMEQLGTIFTYRGFIGGYRLVTMDPRAISYILSRPHEYPKPTFVRDTLASMAGKEGVLVVEGEVHKRQRKILNPSFTASQVNALSPIFYQKAAELRDLWLALVDAAPCSPSLSDDYLPRTPLTPLASHKTLLSPATPTLPLTPRLRTTHSPPVTLRRRDKPGHTRELSHGAPRTNGQPFQFDISHELSETTRLESTAARIDVLHWLGRAMLDVIGLAGFGYSFNALADDRDKLAAAFAEVFSVARKFRFMMVLRAWFPILRYFEGNKKHIDESLETMRKIGLELIRAAHEHSTLSKEALVDFDFRVAVAKDEELSQVLDDKYVTKGRDLLSSLIKSNIATSERERMSMDEILSQISTFMAAGHETTSSALTWTLYALATHRTCQSKLREELANVSSDVPAPEILNELPYLDMVVRESLRLHSPISQTMRVAIQDDIVPVSSPYLDRYGRSRQEIRIRKGDIINIPIQAMNKNKLIFGEDAEQFIPERWQLPSDINLMPTLYSGILTFLHGGRSCIGYRFALLEMKVFIFVLLRDLQFDMCPDLVIEKRANVVTRPLVQSEPEGGNQMPLLLSRVFMCSQPQTS